MGKLFLTGTWIFTISLVLNVYTALSQEFEGGRSEHQEAGGVKPVAHGPERGTLLVIGGHASDSLFLPLFQKLVGGGGEPVVIIPTARSDAGMQDNHFMERQKERFVNYGFKEVHILHTRDREEANSEAFVQPIRKAGGVWFMGGRQWRLSDSYLNTRTHRALERLLDRGGVIAGSSAGATIQGSYLVRGDTRSNTIMMGDHEKGLSFIDHVAVDQHLLARNRHFDMFELLRERPGLLGIGLDENTGIVVEKDTFRVVGESYVAIYDGTRWSAERDTVYQLSQGQEQFYFLRKGQRYDMKQRKVVR